MHTIIHHYSPAKPAHHHFQPWRKFIRWCKSQQDNRIAWLGVSFMLHGCVLAPLTIGIIGMSGNNFLFLALAIAGMIASLSVNLAAQPTKITLPVFFGSIAVDIILVIVCVLHGIHISNTYR